jgi:hypothetical protein
MFLMCLPVVATVCQNHQHYLYSTLLALPGCHV